MRFIPCDRAPAEPLPAPDVDIRAPLLAPRGPFDGDEAWAVAVDAAEILVAGRQVDLALAAEWCLLWFDAQAVGFDRTVAGPLADEMKCENAAPKR